MCPKLDNTDFEWVKKLTNIGKETSQKDVYDFFTNGLREIYGELNYHDVLSSPSERRDRIANEISLLIAQIKEKTGLSFPQFKPEDVLIEKSGLAGLPDYLLKIENMKRSPETLITSSEAKGVTTKVVIHPYKPPVKIPKKRPLAEKFQRLKMLHPLKHLGI